MPPTTLLTACIAITLVTLKANVCFDGDAGDQFWLSPEIAADSDLQNCIHGVREVEPLGVWYFNESPGWIGLQISERYSGRKICLFVNRNMLSRSSSVMDSLLTEYDTDWIKWVLTITDGSFKIKRRRDLFTTPLKSGNDLKDSLLCTGGYLNCTEGEISSIHKLVDVLYQITQFKGGRHILARDRKIAPDIHSMQITMNLLDLANHLGNEHLKILFGSYFAMHLMGLQQEALQLRISALNYD